MRLKVKIRNSKECRTELQFQDLSVKYNNGYAPFLRINEGDEIPLDLLDPEDIKKSLRVGSLKGYIDNGWVVEITEADPLNKLEELRLSNFITEQMMANPVMIAPLKPIEASKKEVLVEEQSPATPILPEVKAEPQKASAPKIEPITDLALVKTFEDFDRLSQFLKLRFIKDSDDFELLKQILGKISSVQLKNNITLRLKQVKNI
jgi:hypothetical protein